MSVVHALVQVAAVYELMHCILTDGLTVQFLSQEYHHTAMTATDVSMVRPLHNTGMMTFLPSCASYFGVYQCPTVFYRGGLRTLMITGDYHHTAVAVAVAKNVGMVKADSRVVVIDTVHKDAAWRDVSPASTPDTCNSSSSLPPQLSLQRRNADFAHALFGLESTKAVWSDSEAELGQSLESRNTSLTRVEVDEGRVTSPAVRLGHRVSFDMPHSSSDSVPGGTVTGKQLSFKAKSSSKLPAGPALANRLAPDAAELPPQSRLSPDSRLHAKVPTKGISSIVPSEAFQLPSEAVESPFGRTQDQRLPARAFSLTRLPSEVTASMTASSAVSSSDNSILSRRQHSSWRHLEKQTLELSHHVVHTSMTVITNPFGRSLDTPSTNHSGVAPESGLRVLTFTSGADRPHMEPGEAFTAMTEGSLQCAVTGDAFEHLLQLHDVSLLEAVMRNAVVFSRMQPHQKGQVMDLLGLRGIHQLFEDHPRHIQVRTTPKPLYVPCR